MEGGHLVIGVKDNTYLKNVLPTNKTEEQQLRMLGDLLKNMSKECLIKAEGRTWYTMLNHKRIYYNVFLRNYSGKSF